MRAQGKYRKWDDSYIVRTVKIVEQLDIWMDGRLVKKARPISIPGRLEIKETFHFGLFAVRACIPAATVLFHVTDDFGNLSRVDGYQFAFSTETGFCNGY